MTLYDKGSSSAFWVNHDAQLRELWADRKLSTRVIASMLGATSRHAVIGRAHRIGLPPKNPKRLSDLAKHRKNKTIPTQIRMGSARFNATAPAEIPQAQRCDIATLTNEACRWPVGHPSDPDFFFCGSPTANLVEGVKYCAHHSALAYRPSQPR